MAVSETTRVMALDLRVGDRIRPDGATTFHTVRDLEWVPLDGRPSTIRVHFDDGLCPSSFVVACYVSVDIEPRSGGSMI